MVPASITLTLSKCLMGKAMSQAEKQTSQALIFNEKDPLIMICLPESQHRRATKIPAHLFPEIKGNIQTP